MDPGKFVRGGSRDGIEADWIRDVDWAPERCDMSLAGAGRLLRRLYGERLGYRWNVRGAVVA